MEKISMNNLPEYMLVEPTVFAVGNKYNIFVPFSDEVIMWVRVGEKNYYDHCNGILRSNTNMHKVELPMSVLDEAKEYTVVYKKMIDRQPYFPTSEDMRLGGYEAVSSRVGIGTDDIMVEGMKKIYNDLYSKQEGKKK